MIETLVVYASRALLVFLAIVFATSFVFILGLECTRGRKKAKPFKGIKLDYKPSRHMAVDLRDTSGTWRRTWRI